MESQNTILNSNYKIEIGGEHNIILKVDNNSFVQLNYEYETYRGYIGKKKRKSPVLTLQDINFPAGETKPVSKLFPYRSKATTYMECCIENIKKEMEQKFVDLNIKDGQFFLSKNNFTDSENAYLFNILRQILRDIFLYCQETGINIKPELNNIPAAWTFDLKD